MAQQNRPGRVRTALRSPVTWIVLVAVVLALGVGGPFIYLRMVSSNNPEELSFSDLESTANQAPRVTTMPTTLPTTTIQLPPPPSETPPPPAAAPPPAAPVPPPVESPIAPPPVVPPPPPTSPIAGTWSVGSGTDARWATDDTILGQTSRVVGRTYDVSGNIQIDNLTITSAHITVNLQTANCGCMHDPAYHEMLETSKFPTANFVLTNPIVFPALPTPGEVVSVPATGNFTIHGVTRSVTFDFETTEVSGRIAFKTSIPVEPGDFAIQPPVSNNPMGSISNTTIDLLIAFDKN